MNSSEHIKLSIKYHLSLIILALAGFALIMLSTNPLGAGISADSVAYISAARSIIKGIGVLYYDGTPSVLYAPLYPALLASIGKISSTDPIMCIRIVNAFLFGLSIYLGGFLTFKYIPSSPVFILVGTLAIVFSKPLFRVSVVAWTEPFFICVVLLSLIFTLLYKAKNGIIPLILFSASISLLPLIRYSGAILIFWGMLVILIINRNNSFKKTMTHLSLFTIISVVPIGLWMIRNYISSSTFFGPRPPSNWTLVQNVVKTFYIIVRWYIPILLFCLFIAFRSFNETIQFIKIKLTQTSPIVLLIFVYTTFLIITATTTRIDEIDDRLLSPIYVPLTLLILMFTKGLVEIYQKRLTKQIAHYLLIAGTLMWLIYPPLIVWDDIKSQYNIGYGYRTKTWKDSPITHYVLQHRLSESKSAVYSNSSQITYIQANFIATLIPYKDSSFSQLKGYWPKESNAYLIWFNNYNKMGDKFNKAGLYSIDELDKIANINLIVKFEDGAIYTLSKK